MFDKVVLLLTISVSIAGTNLTPNQKKALKYIIQNDGLSLYANEALQDGGFSSTTLKSALDSLVKKDICDKKTSGFI
ncbi:MAG TPA: hypothetical protein PLV58_08330 [Campylobacterales bacterium]|nr:hypothetical protein [Campylobacterales bacterium]